MNDTTVRCDVCGREQNVSFGISLRSGWPTCHGYTMRLMSTKADIGKALDRIFRPVDDALRAADTRGRE